jgi:hypothetical protein
MNCNFRIFTYDLLHSAQSDPDDLIETVFEPWTLEKIFEVWIFSSEVFFDVSKMLHSFVNFD